MQYTYYVKGFECEACAKAISKIVAHFPGAALVHSEQATGKIIIECSENDVREIVKETAERGYYLSAEPLKNASAVERLNAVQTGEKSAFALAGKFLGGIVNDHEGYALERYLLETTLLSFFLIIGVEIFVSIFLVGSSFDLSRYKWLFILSAIGIASVAYTAWHAIAYRRDFSCMGGMMVGMTIGMMGGFLTGALLAASNGMFVGAVVGMAIGMLVGAYTGYCCGIMGLLEGLMAGLMGGIMGAMTTIMLLNDHLLEFLFILFGACALVLGGLSYMIYKEAGGLGNEGKLPSGLTLVLLNVLAALLIVAVMVFVPKGPLAWVTFR